MAAKAMGLADVKIIYRHILPNAMTAALTFLPFILSGSISSLTALDFLGFGLPPGSPSSWGTFGTGQSQFAGSVAGNFGFYRFIAYSVPAGIHR